MYYTYIHRYFILIKVIYVHFSPSWPGRIYQYSLYPPPLADNSRIEKQNSRLIFGPCLPWNQFVAFSFDTVSPLFHDAMQIVMTYVQKRKLLLD